MHLWQGVGVGNGILMRPGMIDTSHVLEFPIYEVFLVFLAHAGISLGILNLFDNVYNIICHPIDRIKMQLIASFYSPFLQALIDLVFHIRVHGSLHLVSTLVRNTEIYIHTSNSNSNNSTDPPAHSKPHPTNHATPKTSNFPANFPPPPPDPHHTPHPPHRKFLGDFGWK